MMSKNLMLLEAQEQLNLFRKKINSFLYRPISIRLNSNSSHFISVCFDTNKNAISASIHKFFVDAPDSIMQALIGFIRDGNTHSQMAATLKGYIQYLSENTPKELRYEGSILQKGTWHDLAEISQKLNQEFFQNKLQVTITWFKAKKGPRFMHRCSLGLYTDELSLIKINTLLDNRDVPSCVVSAVVYHEMLHAIYPPYVYPSGRRIIHTAEFKEAEKKYPLLLEAELWLQENANRFFYECPTFS